MENRFWFEPEIRKLIETNDAMVERSVLKIYACQTTDEQMTGETRHSNGVGFSGCDAPLLTSFAQWLESGKHLTPKQMIYARKKIAKYSKQLTAIANSGLPHVLPHIDTKHSEMAFA